MPTPLAAALESAAAAWPADHTAIAAISGRGVTTTGDRARPYSLASVSKLVTALCSLIAVEEGSIGYATEVAAQATLIDTLAHASGLGADRPGRLAPPRTRRIYSTHGYDLIAAAIERATGIPFQSYADEAVARPLGMAGASFPAGGTGGRATLDDLIALVHELMAPTLMHADTHRLMTRVHLPGLAGVLPGFGSFDDNAWGLGPELRAGKSPHWTGARNSPATFGHFGRDGSFVWVDPERSLALVALTDRPFGPWAAAAWPALADAAIEHA